MKLKLNKVDGKKQRRKALIYFAAAVVCILIIGICGMSPLSVAAALAFFICAYEGVIALIMLMISHYQERRQSCVEKEPSSAQF